MKKNDDRDISNETASSKVMTNEGLNSNDKKKETISAENQPNETENNKANKKVKEKSDEKKNKWVYLEAAVVFLLIFLMTVTSFLGSLNYALTDTLYQIPSGVNNRIKIITIDEKTLERFGRIDTWSRQVYADLLSMLNADETARPSVIGFDITFSGNVDEGDQAFAQLAKDYGNVIAVSVLDYETKGVQNQDGLLAFPIEGIVEPYEDLENATTQGFANIALDSDGTVRRIALKETYEGQEYPSFAQVVYEMYCKNNGIQMETPIKDKYGKSLIHFSGKPGSYEAISLIDVLDGKIDCRTFKNSIILVGAYAAGMQDNFRVPNGGSKEMYGVEIHANIVECLLENQFSVTANPVLCGLIFGLLGALLHILMRKNKVTVNIVIAVAAIALQIGVGIWISHHGYFTALLYFPLGVVLSYLYCLVVGYVMEAMKRKKTLQAFKKYVAPEIVEEISKKGEFNIRLGGENRDIAVLFVDIRGFTTMSEALEPEQVVEILNRYLSLTTNSIFKNKGTLDKFVGDATMAVFNAPFDLDDYEYRAVCAALDIVAGAESVEKEFMEKYGKTVGFGVGVNVGPAVVGNIGCEFRMDYTAIGDTVNTAARLEANAKRGQVLISDTLYERVKDRIIVEPVGEIPLKGKSKGVFVYSVKGKKE